MSKTYSASCSCEQVLRRIRTSRSSIFFARFPVNERKSRRGALLLPEADTTCTYRSLRRVATLIDRFDSNNARFIATCNPSGWKRVTYQERRGVTIGQSSEEETAIVESQGVYSAAALMHDDVSALQNSIMRWVRDKSEAAIHAQGQFQPDDFCTIIIYCSFSTKLSSSSSTSFLRRANWDKLPEICKSDFTVNENVPVVLTDWRIEEEHRKFVNALFWFLLINLGQCRSPGNVEILNRNCGMSDTRLIKYTISFVKID